MDVSYPQKGIALNPSFRPWRDPDRLNPDSWWDPDNGPGLIDREIPILRDLNIAVLRIEFPWWGIEKRKKGDFDWSRTDMIVGGVHAAGIQLAPVVVFTPQWAASGCSNPATGCESEALARTCPARAPSATDFADFVFAIVSRYRGRVRFWELWNEPDLPNYFDGTAGDYAQRVLIPGYDAVKRADASAQVIFGGPSSANAQWINAVLSTGGDFDIMAYHDYRGVRSAMEGAGVMAELARGKPVWLNEFGTEQRSRQPGLIRGILGVRSTLAACLWYELRDDGIFSTSGHCRTQTFGLMDHAYNPKPSLAVFRS
jgi:hypothetical protein